MAFKLDFQNTLLVRLVLGAVLINLLVVGVAGFSLTRSFKNFQQRAETTTQNLAHVLAQNIESIVDKVDLGLQMAVEEVERQMTKDKPDAEALNAFMARLQNRLPWVIGLRATDAEGWVTYGTDVPTDHKLSMADRLYFIMQRDNPQLGLFINKPVMSRINKTWVINFARRLNHPDGRFAGVVFANIPLDNFGTMFAAIDIGEQGAINLRDRDMHLIMRHPAPEDIGSRIGQKDISPQFQALLDTGQTTGTFHTPTSFDYVARIVSYNKIGGYPLFISVGLAKDDYLKTWQNEFLQMSALVLLFMLVSGSGTWLIARAWKQQLRITEHLAREEEKFHTVADYPYDWEYWESADHQILYMSPSCERITGYAPAAFIDNPAMLLQVVYAADRELLETHRHIDSNTRASEIDFRIVRSDGEIRWISHCCQAVFDRNGRYFGRRVSNRDITDRRLFESEINRLAQAVDQNPTGILITDLQGVATYTNYAYTRITGYAFGDIYGKPHRELIATEISDEEFTESLKFLASGKNWNRTLRNRHKNGELRWEQIIASPIYDSNFQTCNYLYLRTDITEQKVTQQQLQLLSYALDKVGETIFMMGENDPHFIYANQSAALNLGYNREELTGGMGIFDIDPEWSSETLADFWPKLHEQRRIQFESTHRSREGRLFPVEITGNYFEYDGQIYNLAICRDISERKQTEAALQRLNRELRAVSNCNQALLRAADEQSLLDEVCRIICEEAGYRMAWVGFAEHDAAKTVRPVAWAGVEEGYLADVDISWSADSERGLGPTGIAIRSGEIVYVEDIAADPHMSPWSHNALQRGYRSDIALPLKDDQAQVFGALMIYSEECNAFNQAEIRLMGELVNDLAFGITVMRARLDRQRIEERLHDSEERLRLTLDATQIGVWDWDVSTDQWYASPTYYTMLGYEPQIGLADRREWLDRVHPDDLLLVNEKIQQVLSQDFKDYHYEARMRHADGSYRWQHVRGFGIRRDQDGKVSRMLGIRMDINERKLTEEVLRDSERKYRRIVDTATEGIWVLGSDALTTFVNLRMAEMLGYSYAEMIGHPVTDFMYEGEAHDHLLKTDSRRQGMAESYERRFRHKDGSIIWTLVSATPIFDDEQHFKGALAMMTNITERKLAEEQLRNHKEQLEATVQQRTAELLVARDAAEAANKAKSQFLANMSHELRTPLNAILGFSGLMRLDSQLSIAQRENLDIINRSGSHLLKLINDVLEVAKIESGYLNVDIAPFDLGELIRDVTEMMQIRAQEKGLRLILDQTSEFPRYIKSDEARIRQILINLINNAVKFTDQGGVTVRLGVKENAHHHLLIEVEDSGPGIAPEDRTRLFEPFVQLSEDATQRGTGLGLTITRQFVNMLGGSIVVESTLGEGALFRVELPVDLADTNDILQQDLGKHGQIVGLAPGQPVYRILIVEDQRENQLLLSRLMTNLGMDVKVAENGKRCLELFEDWRPDLIWMDRRMPVMDGIEATQRLRRLPGGQTVKIVAVTASAFKEQQQEMLDAGMDDFVRKPYRFEEIYDCMSRQLDVTYIYQSEPPVVEAAAVTLTADMLAVIPKALRQQLRDALISLDSEKIAESINQVIKVDATLGLALSHLADYFDYPSILDALDTDLSP